MKAARFLTMLPVLIAGVFLLTYSSCKKDESCPPSITYEGQTYNTVLIGDQCWFKENLNYATGNSWCYDNDHAKCATYGRLYDWETALGVCPSGWHTPSDAEWIILTDYLGGTNVAGDKMKSSSGWHNNGNGSNSSGFTALPSGSRSSNGNFGGLMKSASFWSSTEKSSFGAWYRSLSSSSGYLHENVYSKGDGNSVRCLQD